jgi:hypothetical protein
MDRQELRFPLYHAHRHDRVAVAEMNSNSQRQEKPRMGMQTAMIKTGATSKQISTSPKFQRGLTLPIQ